MNNELIIGQTTETIDSREVAKMVDMQHNDLLKKIRNYQHILDEEELPSPQFFILSGYLNSQNKSQPCYLLTKKGCEMVANKLTGKKGVIFTAKYVERFEQMEKKLQQPKLPGDYIEAVEMLLDQLKINQQLVLENNQLKFNFDTDKKPQKNDLYTTEQIAKEHGMSAVKLNKLLFEKRVQYPRKGTWFLYSKYKSKNYIKRVHGFPKWTIEGKQFIEVLLQGQ